MRIAILTLPLHTNYGGILQAYALQTILQQMGHSVEVLQKVDTLKLSWKTPLIYTKRVLWKYILHKGGYIFAEKHFRREKEIIEYNTRNFISKNIHIHSIKSFKNLRAEEYDVYVVGSDQIWRPKYVRSLWRSSIENAFLKFAEKWNVRRIAYAPSFGVDNWEYTKQETDECRRLIQKFNAISTREKNGYKLCKEILNVSAPTMLDPTLLLTADDYKQLFEKVCLPNSSPYLFKYILDNKPAADNFVKKVAKDRELKIFKGNSETTNQQLTINERIQPPVEEWISGIANSEFIVTDSFHACVFAIIFKKPFITLGNQSRGMERFNSLLSTFNLENNLLSDISDYNSSNSYLPGLRTYDILESLKDKSLKFIEKGLG